MHAAATELHGRKGAGAQWELRVSLRDGEQRNGSVRTTAARPIGSCEATVSARAGSATEAVLTAATRDRLGCPSAQAHGD